MNRLSPLHTDPASAIGYRIAEPIPAQPTALLVLLHGVGGNELHLAGLANAVPAGTLVVLAQGRLTLAPNQFAWFHVSFTAAGPQFVQEEAEGSRIALIRLVRQLQLQYGISPTRTAIAGFSQGGILSASVGLSAPDAVAGFAVLSGRILPELDPVIAPRERLSKLHALIAHGRDDDTLAVSWAERARAWLDRLGVAHELRLYAGGHILSAEMAQDFTTWLTDLLTPTPSAEALELLFDPDATRLRLPGEAPLRIAPGIAEVVQRHLAPTPSLAYALEEAIASIEDELARVPRGLHGHALVSRDPHLVDIARTSGVDAKGVLRRDAVEHVFSRQSAVAMGRPAAAEQLPDQHAFIATLLLTRELMHHLNIETITLAT